MFSRSIRTSVEPRLHDGERLLAAVLAQNAGANTAMMTSAVRTPIATGRARERAHQAHQRAAEAADTAGLAVDHRMVIALTTHRLLMFKSGGAFTAKAKHLLGEAPIAAVEAIDVDRDGQLTKAVTLHVHGAAIRVETARGQHPEALSAALRQARTGHPTRVA
jgi:hypothetical protein